VGEGPGIPSHPDVVEKWACPLATKGETLGMERETTSFTVSSTGQLITSSVSTEGIERKYHFHPPPSSESEKRETASLATGRRK